MDGHRGFRVLSVIAAVACYVTILLGGNVMASDSGLACPEWPSCHGTFTPPLAGGMGIEWAHRLGAFVLSVIIVVLTLVAVAFERSRPVLVRLSFASLATVVGQALLGGLVVESDLTVGVVLLHLGLATALFGMLVLLALIANFHEIPRRWVDWARRASEEVPEAAPGPFGGPSDGPTPPGPAPHPTSSGGAARSGG